MVGTGRFTTHSNKKFLLAHPLIPRVSTRIVIHVMSLQRYPGVYLVYTEILGLMMVSSKFGVVNV